MSEYDDDDDWENTGSDLDVNLDTLEVKGPPNREDEEDEEDNWDDEMKLKEETIKKPTDDTTNDTGEGDNLPNMFILNVTKMTKGEVHSKNDRNSNNNPSKVSEIRKEAEGRYGELEGNGRMVGEGIVIPVGGSVWKEALKELRDRHVGEFFLPIFKR